MGGWLGGCGWEFCRKEILTVGGWEEVGGNRCDTVNRLVRQLFNLSIVTIVIPPTHLLPPTFTCRYDFFEVGVGGWEFAERVGGVLYTLE